MDNFNICRNHEIPASYDTPTTLVFNWLLLLRPRILIRLRERRTHSFTACLLYTAIIILPTLQCLRLAVTEAIRTLTSQECQCMKSRDRIPKKEFTL